jgi:hypothetical protein
MINVIARLLKHLGINPERVLLEWVSAAEGPRFAQVVTDFTNQIKEMGPLGTEAHSVKEHLNIKLEAAARAVSGVKLRWVAAKQTEFLKDGNKYGEDFTAHEMGRLLDGLIVEEVMLQQILVLLENEALSVKEISRQLEVPPPLIFQQILAMRRKDLVEVSEIKDRSPIYAVCDKGV